MDVFATIDERASSANLEYLIIGGHAVNAHGYLRTTLDVDLLVSEAQLPEWKEMLTALGYVWGHETPAFVQFAQPPGTEEFPIDLMVVNATTFRKLSANAVAKDFGKTRSQIPRTLDLIALKLHALRSSARAAEGKDLADILALVRVAKLDLNDPEFCAILERHATPEIRDELRRHLS